MPGHEPLPRLLAGITLRRLAPEDLDAFQAYRNDPELGRYQGWSPMPDAQASSFLAAMRDATLFRPGAWTQIGIAGARDGQLVGDIGVILAHDGRHAEIGFTLGRPWQRRGLATRAVSGAIALVWEQTAARRILAITDARNLPSIRLLERLGMHRCEVRSAVFRGESCEEFVFALAREDRDGFLPEVTLGGPP